MSIEDKYDEVRQLINIGKEKGYLLYDEVNELLPSEITSAEDLDELFNANSAILNNLLTVLNEREKDVLMQRRLSEEPVTLEELSESYGVSRERIRQIEVRAFEKLQKAMLRIAGEKRLLAA